MSLDQTGHDPRKRLFAFFESLYRCLRKGARAALQFYPENAQQLELITASAMRAGFSGGLIVDFPNSTKAKKYFLCLSAGPPDSSRGTPKVTEKRIQPVLPLSLHVSSLGVPLFSFSLTFSRVLETKKYN